MDCFIYGYWKRLKGGWVAMIIKIPRSECYRHGMTDSSTPIEYEHQPPLYL